MEGKGKTYRSTSSPLSFSILSEVGRGGWWGVWLCFATMLWTLAEERFGVWSRLAAWHFQPYGKCSRARCQIGRGLQLHIFKDSIILVFGLTFDALGL